MSARKRYEVRVVHPSVAVPDRVARVLATDANDALNRGVKKIFGRSASKPAN